MMVKKKFFSKKNWGEEGGVVGVGGFASLVTSRGQHAFGKNSWTRKRHIS